MIIKIKPLSFLTIVLLLLSLCGGIERGFAQVQIAPVTLHMDEKNQTGRIVVRNTTDQPVELNTTLHYGYPATNAEGTIYLKLLEDVPQEEPSMAQWTRVYPPHLILPARQQQTIRFAVRPPQDLPPGEYWMRPAIAARSLDPLTDQETAEITSKINIIKRTFLSAYYRHGPVKTGVVIHNLKARLDGNILHFKAQLERKGNAAYLGHLDMRIVDSSNSIRKQFVKEIAVYHELMPTHQFDVSDLQPGTYSLQLNLYTKYRAEDDNYILNAPPASRTETIAINL